MCYDISFTVNIESVYDYFPELIADDQIEINFDFSAHIPGHAYAQHPVICRYKDDGELHLKLMEWGIIPYYTKDEKAFLPQRANMLNIRSERILDDKTSYWYKIRSKRCLIPVTGTFEHRTIKGWKKKVPYLIKIAGVNMFFIPGLYSVTELPDQDGVLHQRYTVGMITRAANSLMSKIHNSGPNSHRMPLFLPFEMALQWLNKELPDDHYRELLNYEIPSEKLEYYTVNTIRSPKPREDGKPKTAPFKWEKLPELREAE